MFTKKNIHIPMIGVGNLTSNHLRDIYKNISLWSVIPHITNTQSREVEIINNIRTGARPKMILPLSRKMI